MKTKPIPAGILHRCENPPCHNLVEDGRFCSIECGREAAKLIKTETRSCACGCGKTFTVTLEGQNKNKRFFSVACSTRDKITRIGEKWDDHRARQNKSRVNQYEVLGPGKPLNEPWTPKPKPKPVMTDDEQAEINKAAAVAMGARMAMTLTPAIARRMGVAV